MFKPVRVQVSGPLAPFRDGFQAWLIGRGYARGSVARELRLMACLSGGMDAEGMSVAGLNTLSVKAFMAERRGAGVPAARFGSSGPLLEYLAMVGVLMPVVEPRPGTWTEALLTRYGEFLSVERGLTTVTVRRNVALMRPFLIGLRREDEAGLTRLTASEVTGFVVSYSRRRPKEVPAMVTALRSLLRFLQVEGLVAAGLVDAVPSVARRTLAGLPKALAADQVTAVIESCDRDTVIGRRDLAILTVLSRLGLRAGEVAALRLDDIDWRLGEFTVSGKGNRDERLPLPHDVGQPIVAYLLDGRPATGAREVFLGVRAPHRAMTRGAVTQTVARAAGRAGLGTVYAHRLRHSAATAILGAGGSLEEIGQVLRHRHPLTTAIYAKVDIDGLRTIARAWPESGARS
jgi:site-specific recombinase XerD